MLKKPARQVEQYWDPSAEAYLPALHWRHSALPETDSDPAGHLLQLDDDGFGL
jgi:hypothetical protein